ncbi:MAG: glycogen debranching protein GlgX [Sedimentisphaerales bacterium]|nr:glycogen debranching protein GlgX [Sedimentisphaerales bacterium]
MQTGILDFMTYILEHKKNKRTSAGSPNPLGATPMADGVNFALFSQYAKEVFLLLFDSADTTPTDVIKIENKTENIWHVFVHGLKAGQLYGYKVNGDYDPAKGLRFNPYKLLIDPYAKALTGKIRNKDNLIYAYDINSPKKDLAMDQRDNTFLMPKAIVVDDAFDWQGVTSPGIPIEKLVIYEVHVKGFTAHKSSGVRHPGSYLGFIEKIPYLKELGINAVEFLPVNEFHISDRLIKNGLTEFWGYNTICYFSPEFSYSTQSQPACQVTEFKALVRELHRAGIEVILDVVYNHTGEGGALGPTLCFKGIDNPTYYLLKPKTSNEPLRCYKDDVGCKNTVNAENLPVLRLILDALRYWVSAYHIDGFRFDICPIVARLNGQFSRDSAFFKGIAADPVFSKVKLITEPWEPTADHNGQFPKGWAEWNGKFRDTARRFIRGDAGQITELTKCLTGFADIYKDDENHPSNSINFITCHDGFTLVDLFSYNDKHNEANHEDNKDGTNDNHSTNCGVEGQTSDTNVIALRKKLLKNAVSILLFSSGTPMVLYGDEIMRTQKGNNNAYCQDNELTWLNWQDVQTNRDILEFFKKAIALRKQYTVLEQKGIGSEITWCGKNLDTPQPEQSRGKILCYQVHCKAGPNQTQDCFLFFILNAAGRGAYVKLMERQGLKWYQIVDTSRESGEDFLPAGKEELLKHQNTYHITPRSIAVLVNK